jgi:Cu(I)/Ag(I) efflux system membrane protein CusA/SilA
LSFVPVFTLEAQEGRLFGAARLYEDLRDGGVAASPITLVPVLMGYWIRGRIPASAQSLNRALIALYRRCSRALPAFPRTTLVCAAASR